MISINPATLQQIGEYPNTTNKEISTIINNMSNDYLLWKDISINDRVELIVDISSGTQSGKRLLSNEQANEYIQCFFK